MKILTISNENIQSNISNIDFNYKTLSTLNQNKTQKQQ